MAGKKSASEIYKRGAEISDVLGEIRYSGEFNYDKLYHGIYSWFKDMLYEVTETYKHKMTGSGAEVELAFKGEKKISEFMRWNMECETKIWGMGDVESVKDGKKQKLNKGRILITISWKLTLDYSSRYSKTEWAMRMFNFIRYTLLRKKIIIVWAGRITAESYRLHTEIKKLLNMETAYSAWE